jgi:hypothetical protein
MMFTLFTVCHLQVCRLSFFPYVIKLSFAAESSMGERIGQEIEKTRTGARRYKATCWRLNLSACEARRLYGVCVELLELCSHVSGRIDPQAGWMVAHARDEVMLGIFDVKP